MKPNRRGFAPILIILIVAAVLAAGGGAYYLVKQKSQAPQPVACTQEAKQCPDGSYVARTGPNCEFAQCPSTDYYEQLTTQCHADKCCLQLVENMKAKGYRLAENNVCPASYQKNTILCPPSYQWCEPVNADASNWKTYRNEKYGFEFKYPSGFFSYQDLRGAYRRDQRQYDEITLANYDVEKANEEASKLELPAYRMGDKEMHFSVYVSPAEEVHFDDIFRCAFVDPMASSSQKFLMCKDVEINGYIYRKYLINYSPNSYWNSSNFEHTIFGVIAKYGNEMYQGVASYRTGGESAEKFFEVSDQIFSTFKFIEPADTACALHKTEQSCLADKKCFAYYERLEAPPPIGESEGWTNITGFHSCAPVNATSTRLNCEKMWVGYTRTGEINGDTCLKTRGN